MKKLGIDIGSTTIKYVLLNDHDEVICKDYARHHSLVFEGTANILEKLHAYYEKEALKISITGSAGMGVCEQLRLPFVQEIVATSFAINKYIPQSDTVIELGGEDAKIIYLKGNKEFRMNGSCAGGTGAFIDQMVELLNTDIIGFNDLCTKHKHIYQIASRCGVFAKTDLQQLLNQGATKEDLAASVLYAVVHQTMAGLAHGRPIHGKVIYLGGPLTFLPYLREAFDHVLQLKGICPENSLYFAAMGSALLGTNNHVTASMHTADEIFTYIWKLKNHSLSKGFKLEPLFSCKQEYEEFQAYHNTEKRIGNCHYHKNLKYYLGIDAGSTTVKAVVINEYHQILYKKYMMNTGNPLLLVQNILDEIYTAYDGIKISYSAVTGYGESLIENAFGIDCGIVETLAHYTAAIEYNENVDFIIDIGGQDMKCFKIREHHIEDIFLNEACSSGCGSFLSTFATSLGYKLQEFINLGLFAKSPVELGSRCTVFMNSAVKQAQKEGATVADISAGLSISVVKNALYKVLRITDSKELGENILVQGGTFLNDAVLRAFERELSCHVIRPEISGLMGAFGAALYAEKKHIHCAYDCTLMTHENLKYFKNSVSFKNCTGCENHCHLTVNTFSNGKKYIGGNRCNFPITGKKLECLNLFAYKRNLLKNYTHSPWNSPKKDRKTIGLPMALNMYECLPFWHTLFTKLGFNVVVSPVSTKSLYLQGQHTIPSDTACYPAKIMHGHIHYLLSKKVHTIFYPCMNYALDEKQGNNRFNCPVVAFYPEVIEKNITFPPNVDFICETVDLNKKTTLHGTLYKMFLSHSLIVDKKLLKKAIKEAFVEYESYKIKIKSKAMEFQNYALLNKIPIIILAGRPYHIDNELNHGIDSLISDMGAVVLSEDAFTNQGKIISTKILNQWTFQSRLLSSADFVASSPKEYNINLVHLVSFSCGTDAILADEIRRILEAGHKIYTQIKIDEISNLSAARIRLRSLFATLDM